MTPPNEFIPIAPTSKVESLDVECRVPLDELVLEVLHQIANDAIRKGTHLILDADPNLPRTITIRRSDLSVVLQTWLGSQTCDREQAEMLLSLRVDASSGGEKVLRFELRETGSQTSLASNASADDTLNSSDQPWGLVTSRNRVEWIEKAAHRLGAETGILWRLGRSIGSWLSLPLPRTLDTREPLGFRVPDADRLEVWVFIHSDALFQPLSSAFRAAGLRVRRSADPAELPTAFASDSDLPPALIVTETAHCTENFDRAVRQLWSAVGSSRTPVLHVSKPGDLAPSRLAALRLVGPVGQLGLPAGPRQLVESFMVLRSGFSLRTTLRSSAESSPNPPVDPCPALVFRGSPLKILLVEDNPVNIKITQAQLSRMGCKTLVAENGQLALDALLGNRVNIVLMDCQMPVMDGYEATRRIREIEQEALGKPGAPQRLQIIAVTANAMPGDREKCLDAGMDDYVPKPVRLAALHEALTRAMTNLQGEA